ncbi:MAG: hypothetical protein FWG63_04005 [Defluviitaleaceae bacterium]|nr:hypothetical protein [Defluviitaleaceae bacterium]
MRKFHKQQILEIIETLYQAQEEKLYADCQDTALSLCDYIDNLAGPGTQVVSMLEQYSRLLFNANSGEAGIKQLRSSLIKIENNIRNQLPATKIEMAFLSYKASMSDSLESIYLAAKADPDCEPYFVPIPYYDVLPNKELGQINYEGEEHYSNRIEITHYTNYDIEARRPEAIFNFNPYDEFNLLTRVPPEYYSKNLKKSTDMLVYIPYVVTTADELHLNLFPGSSGIRHSHRVVLSSEPSKDAYVKKMEKMLKTEPNISSKLQKKFVVLGSPKLDKVINSTKQDFYLPDEWRKIINNKKVVLYGLSIHNALEQNELYLKNLRHVFEMFKNNKDVALWLRPHPLLATTYQTLRPLLAKEYNKILADYEKEAWGILDKTADLHRAITYTDAYYGDYSSVELLYGIKPALVVRQEYQPAGREERIKNFLEQVLTAKSLSSEEKKEAREKFLESDKIVNGDGTSGYHIYNYIKEQISK